MKNKHGSCPGPLVRPRRRFTISHLDRSVPPPPPAPFDFVLSFPAGEGGREVPDRSGHHRPAGLGGLTNGRPAWEEIEEATSWMESGRRRVPDLWPMRVIAVGSVVSLRTVVILSHSSWMHLSLDLHARMPGDIYTHM